MVQFIVEYFAAIIAVICSNCKLLILHMFACAAMVAAINIQCKVPLNKQRGVAISHVIGDGMIVPRIWFGSQTVQDLRLDQQI